METDNLNAAPGVKPRKSGRRAGIALAAAGVLGGALVSAAIVAGAASPTPSPAGPAATSPSRATFDPSKGGHVGANGVVEKLLTGTAADKARAAALAAVPSGTIERVENDAEGATYEAHMVKSDGSHVTVKMDANFKVTGIENGPGAPSA